MKHTIKILIALFFLILATGYYVSSWKQNNFINQIFMAKQVSDEITQSIIFSCYELLNNFSDISMNEKGIVFEKLRNKKALHIQNIYSKIIDSRKIIKSFKQKDRNYSAIFTNDSILNSFEKKIILLDTLIENEPTISNEKISIILHRADVCLIELQESVHIFIKNQIDYFSITDLKLKKINIKSQSWFATFDIMIFILCIFFVLSISILITLKLKTIQTVINEIAAGNITFSKEKTIRNEIDVCYNQLIKTSTNLRTNIIGLNESIRNISSASIELSNTAQQLSEGASEQASSSEEVSSSMEEMVGSIQQNGENAQHTHSISQQINQQVEESGVAVGETLNAMVNVAEKIGIIQEIANKTDLLAINAGIEAARAGEYGKGFSFLASEIRKLAEKTNQASVEIATLIKSSLILAQKSNNLLTNLVPEIEKTSQLVNEIAITCQEQTQNATHINIAINQLNLVTQQNAVSSEELAASVVEFSSQTEQLLNTMDFYKTGIDRTVTPKTNLINYEEFKHKNQTQSKQNTQGVFLNINDNSDSNFETYKL